MLEIDHTLNTKGAHHTLRSRASSGLYIVGAMKKLFYISSTMIWLNMQLTTLNVSLWCLNEFVI